MWRLPGAVAAAATLAVPAGATALTFGADLNRPANSAVDCTVLPSVGGFGFPTNVTSCTYAATGRFGDFTEGFNVPAGRGTITAVRVRVGPVTGPMQVVIFRSLRDPLSTAAPVCCKVVGLSPVFTPAPNAVTTIQTAFAVRNDRVVEPGLLALEFDTMALSVLAPGVPMPAHDTGVTDPLLAQGALGFFPALTVLGEERVGPAGIGGYQVLMNAEWIPTPEGTAQPAVPGVAPAAIRLVQPVVSVSGPVISLGLRCTQATPCVGVFRLQSARVGQAGAQAQAARVTTYATSRFRIGAGRAGKVGTRLNAAGRRLAARRNATAWANVTMGGRVVSSTRVTLRRK
ncbi:MAG: hypothetical protein AB1416_03885 [Actinomycetota bacterium]